MLRFFLFTINILSCAALFAKSSYQIDLILFAYPQTANTHSAMYSPLIPVNKNAIPLTHNTNKSIIPYSLLAPSQSALRDEYYQLSRRSSYKVLSHYSWRQTSTSQSVVALPHLSSNGWEMQGTVRVRQGTYYLLDAELQFSPPNNPQAAFKVSQHQRLKSNTVYFLDHPQIGMIIKVHPLT